MHQNYPNPFNPSTDINIDLSADQNIRLEVYDAIGRLVYTLADGPFKSGYHTFTWNGIDADSHILPAGTYFYRLQTPTSTEMKQMLLVK